MITLPLMPYHGNLADYWNKHSHAHLDFDFWEWVEKYHGAQLVRAARPEVWKFKNEGDMILFALRWS